MNNLKFLSAGAIGLWLLSASFAFADTSLAIQSLSPGSAVLAKSVVSFNLVATGFSALTYQISDSFGNTSVNVNDISNGGQFTWIPQTGDVGTHTLTITASDYSGASASATQTIIVSPPPSLSVSSLSPGSSIMPGTTLTFTVSAPGFTNPSFIAGDSFSGATVGDANIDASGNFSWKPDVSQNGQHTITIYGSDSLGHHASVDVNVQVGIGPTIVVQSLTPGSNVSPGQAVSFNVNASNFVPTSFSLIDSFAGTTSVSNANISALGAFSWTPAGSDIGAHVLTIKGIVGAYGQSATTSQTINVLGANGALPASAPTASSTASGGAAAALQAQLLALQAQLAAAQGGSASSGASSGFTFSLYLRPGSSGDEVMRLQQLLSKLGFLTVAPNGNYGPGTTAAVIKFQAAHELSRLGVVGPATRAALNAALAGQSSSGTTASTAAASSADGGFVFEHFMGYGDTDPDVVELQKKLIALGFLASDSQLGFYGNATTAAVKKFQLAHSLADVGYVDVPTRSALNQ